MDALERDFYEERRRTWRRSAFWRGFFVAFALLLILMFVVGFSSARIDFARDHVARYQVDGFIGDSAERDALLKELAETDAARAVIVRINSPGGTTAGAEALYASIRHIAEEKPVVAVLSEVAASGGYIAAAATDHIVTRGSTLTGSIGVIMEYPDVTGVLDRLGIEWETYRSSPLKAEPSPLRQTSEAAREVSEAMIADTFLWFRDLVGERRELSGPSLDEAANGAVFTGRVALDMGLVDEIGGETEALVWLESQRNGVADLPVVDWAVPEEDPLIPSILGSLGSTDGILGEISLLRVPKLYSIGP
ncbi:MAG: signal peptide peptidase SppA [Pseudomonadota bacterium]